MSIKVSVIIPTFNRANTITKSIYSVLNQTYSNIEVIVVDDNSEDNTSEIIGQIQDDRLIYIRNSQNLGAAGTRNVGIKNSSGEFIAFQDSDDEWSKLKLEKQVKKILDNKNYGAVYCAFMYSNKEIRYQIPNASESVSDLEGDIFNRLLLGNVVSTQTLLVKRNVFDDVGVFNETLMALEDWELALRISRKYLFGYVNESLVDVHYSENSVNENIENLSVAQSYIYSTYLKYALDKVTCTEGILYMLKTIKKVKNEDVYHKCINMLFSVGILNEFSLALIGKEIVRSERFEEKYNLLVRMLEHDAFAKHIKEMISIVEKDNNSVALYGAGKIGKILYKALEKEEFRPRCIIDRNIIIDNEITIISRKAISSEIKVIVMTILGEEETVEQIKKDYNVKVLFLEKLI